MVRSSGGSSSSSSLTRALPRVDEPGFPLILQVLDACFDFSPGLTRNKLGVSEAPPARSSFRVVEYLIILRAAGDDY